MNLNSNNKYYLNYFGHVHYYKSYLKVQAYCSQWGGGYIANWGEGQ